LSVVTTPKLDQIGEQQSEKEAKESDTESFED
jgi:hypothetical protein